MIRVVDRLLLQGNIRLKNVKESQAPIQILGVGDWESLVAACRALSKHPRRVEELMERTTDFYCACLEQVLSQVSLNYASLYEPIAANTGQVINPAMFERFAIPG